MIAAGSVEAPGGVRHAAIALGAMMRASWKTASSYRLQFLFALAGLVVTVVPMFFVARAVQPIAAGAIAHEGGHYFGFVLLGTACVLLLQTCTLGISQAVNGGIASGTFEAMLVTPTRTPVLLAGFTAYGIAWTSLRVVVMLAGGAVLGMQMRLAQLPAALVVLAILLLAYLGFGLLLGAMSLAFRTTGPLPQAIIAGSTLLGGVYYPTHVIPPSIQHLSALVPLTYGLRALRQLLLDGAPLGSVMGDVGRVSLCAALTLGLGAGCFALALRHARRAGTLSQY